MRIELIKTREHDGDWYKILVDGKVKECIGCFDHEAESLIRAEDIFDWFAQNEGEKQNKGEVIQVIKSVEI